jgi:hypothetical protein
MHHSPRSILPERFKTRFSRAPDLDTRCEPNAKSVPADRQPNSAIGRNSEPFPYKWVTDSCLIRPSGNGWRCGACEIPMFPLIFACYKDN